jgi:hypothetical protein
VKQVSVSADTYRKLKTFATAQDVSIASVVDAACSDLALEPILLPPDLAEQIRNRALDQGLAPATVVRLAMERLTRRDP